MGRWIPFQLWQPLSNVFILAAFCSCTHYSGQLERAQGYYEQNQYDRALAIFRRLDAHREQLDEGSQLRYFYLRGMIDYRLGYRTDARYWLGLASSRQTRVDLELELDEKERLSLALANLNQSVYEDVRRIQKQEPLLQNRTCTWTGECPSKLRCLNGQCQKVTLKKKIQQAVQAQQE